MHSFSGRGGAPVANLLKFVWCNKQHGTLLKLFGVCQIVSWHFSNCLTEKSEQFRNRWKRQRDHLDDSEMYELYCIVAWHAFILIYSEFMWLFISHSNTHHYVHFAVAFCFTERICAHCVHFVFVFIFIFDSVFPRFWVRCGTFL